MFARVRLCFGSLFVFNFLLSCFCGAAEFKGIAIDHGGGTEIPVRVSPNGRVLVGAILTNAPSAFEAFRLDLATGYTVILTNTSPGPDLTGSPWSRSYGASADGSTVLIQSYQDNYCFLNDCNTFEYQGYSWNSGNLTHLPWLSGDDQAWPLDVTADGNTAVGYSWERAHTLIGPYNYYRNAVMWNTVSGAVTDLGNYGDSDAWATAVSEDGTVIVGQSGLLRGDEDYDETWWRPVFWRPAYGWYPLERFHSNSSSAFMNRDGNIAHGMSNDGKIAVGNLHDNTSHILPVFWNLDPNSANFQKATVLPLLPGDNYESGKAFTSSKNIPGRGYVIGGFVGEDLCIYDYCSGDRQADAVLWETNNLSFPVKVQTLLLGLGLENDTKGWQLQKVTSISDDAKVLTGTGIHPNGQSWNWYADLRNPQPNETRAKAQYIGQSAGNLFTNKAKVGGSTVDASPSITPVQYEKSKLRPTVWYSYSAPVDGYLALDLAGTMSFSLLSVYRENGQVPMAYTQTCSDPASVGPCFYQGELKIDANTMYYISVGGMEVPQGEESFDLYHQFTPISDSCEEAFYLSQTLPTEVSGSTKHAAVATAPVCNSVDVTSPGVWFKVVGTGGTMTASLDGTADFDTQLSVYCSGCGASPACITANDDINGQYNQDSEVSWCALSGKVYHLLVHGNGNDSGDFALKVSSVPSTCIGYSCPVSNTSCAAPIPIEDEGTTIWGDNTNAGTITSQTACGEVNNDVWYEYTAKCDGQVVVDTCQHQGDLIDTVLALYDSCGGTELICNDNISQGDCSGTSRSAIFYDVDPGQKLAIMAAEFGSSPQVGTFPLRVQEMPGNVDIKEISIPDAEQGQSVHIQLPISGGCPRQGYLISTGSSSLPPGLTLDANGLISGIPAAAGKYNFEVSVTDGTLFDPSRSDSAQFEIIVRPANETCQTAQSVAEGLTLFGNTGANSQVQPPAQCNGTTFSSDVWFNYVSSCTGIATVSTCGSSFDTTLALYQGGSCPDSGAGMQCSTDSVSCGAGSKQSGFEMDVTQGQSYLLRVGSSDISGGIQGNGQLLITCFNDCNNNSINDLNDIGSGTSSDSNNNSIPDECEKAATDFSLLLYLPAILEAATK